MDESTDAVETGVAAVKQPEGHGSHRITPPIGIRDATGMDADEAWSWFWSPEEERFYLRRTDESLAGLPDDVRSSGVAEARENGRYLDFAIPTTAVETSGIEKGQSWRFEAADENTIVIEQK